MESSGISLLDVGTVGGKGKGMRAGDGGTNAPSFEFGSGCSYETSVLLSLRRIKLS